MSVAPPLLEGTAAVAAIALAAAAARALSIRLLPGASRSLRLAGAGVLLVALLVGAFRVLATAGLFGALPALVVFAAIAWASGTRPAPGGGSLREALATPWSATLVPGVLVLAASALRGLAAPPLGWDALTYHLFRAGRWARDGHDAAQVAPGAWGYYEWFPRTGDSLWSWAFLGSRDGALLAVSGVAVLLGVAGGAYALARACGADRRDAVLAGGAVALTPAVANALTVAYVDNTVLALTLAGAALGVDALRTGGKGRVALAGLALGLACATKYSMLPPLAGALAVVAWRLRLRGAGLFAAAASAPLAAECLDRWIATGSPFWPFRVAVAGREIFAGNPELVAMYQARLGLPGQEVFHAGEFLRWLFSPGRHEFAQSLGIGPVFPVVAAVALVAAVRACRDPVRRPTAVILAVLATLTIAGTLGEDYLALRTLWAQVYARFTMPAFALAIVAASAACAPWSRGALALHALVGAALAWPHGWSEPDGLGASRALVAAGAAIVACALAARIPKALPTAVRSTAVAVATALPILLLLPPLRADLRYAIYERASFPSPAFDMHELNRRYAAAWPIWKALDGAAPRRIAVAAGWDGTGHNAYLYPLLGSRLQNEVVYVPPTADGRPIDYRLGEELAAVASHEAWTRRLVEERIDVVVALAPPPPERIAWIERDPEHFEPLAASADGSSAAWTVYPPGSSRPAR